MKRAVALGLAVFLFLVSPVWAKDPQVLVKTLADSHKMTAGGGFSVVELLNPRNDKVDPGFSIAYVSLQPGKATEPHKLLNSSQVYYVVKGEAVLHANGKTLTLKPGMAVYLAPGVVQWAENRGHEEFAFLCVVSPPWRPGEEVVKKEYGHRK